MRDTGETRGIVPEDIYETIENTWVDVELHIRLRRAVLDGAFEPYGKTWVFLERLTVSTSSWRRQLEDVVSVLPAFRLRPSVFTLKILLGNQGSSNFWFVSLLEDGCQDESGGLLPSMR